MAYGLKVCSCHPLIFTSGDEIELSAIILKDEGMFTLQGRVISTCINGADDEKGITNQKTIHFIIFL